MGNIMVKEKAYDATHNPNKRCKTMPSSSHNEANTLPTSSLQQTYEVETGVRGGEHGAVGSSSVNRNKNKNKNKNKIKVVNIIQFQTGLPGGSRNEVTYTTISSQEQTNEGEIEVRDVEMAQTEARSTEQELGEGGEQENWNEIGTEDSMLPIQRGIHDAHAHEQDKKCFSGLSPNIKLHVRLGKCVQEASDCVAEPTEKSKFEGGFVIDAPPPAVELLLLPRLLEKASIDRTLQELLKCIRNERFHTVGIWGMGGAGKTTVMKALNNSPDISKGFDIVIWVTVSRLGSVEMIQERVARRLSLSLRNEESIESRASKISQTLSSKRFLLLLDDVWEMIDLENVGIPYQGNGSKVVLTTRSLTVCYSMKTSANVKVDVLSEEETWNLFSCKVSEVVNSESITEYAKAVVKECDGLPLAIIVLGAALRNTDDVHVWRNVLRELQSPTSLTIKGMEDRVFRSLKFSYDHLRDDNMKQCFLYCASYPKDCEINDTELIEYWRAKGLTGDARTVKAAYDKGRAILNILVQSSLLEKRGDKNYVMHGVIRDLALRIKSRSGNNVSFLVRAGLGVERAPTGLALTEIATHLQQFSAALADMDLRVSSSLVEIQQAIQLQSSRIDRLYEQRDRDTFRGTPSLK